MRLRLAVPAALLALAAPAAAQSDRDVLSITGGWRVASGDSAAWAAPGHDDAAWAPVAVPGYWETVLPQDYDGFGWYRVSFAPPPSLAGGGPVGVQLGTVGDAFELFWNGVRIGGAGRFPPDFQEGVAPTLVLVPPEALAASPDGRHHLALRIYNRYAYGGILGEVRVGPYEALANDRSPRDMIVGGLVSFFVAIGVYHLAFYFRRRSARENLYFAVLSLCVSVYGATYSAALTHLLIERVNPYRVGMVSLLVAGPFFLALVYRLFELPVRRRERAICAAMVAAAAVAAVLPLGALAEFAKGADVFLVAGLLAIVARCGMAMGSRRPHAILLVTGTTGFAAALIYDLASEYGFVPVARVLPDVPSLFWLGFLVFVVAVGIATAGKWALTEVTALVDPLTELSRRHVLEEALRREADRVHRTGGAVAMVMIDLDHFKRVNDVHGHRAGDEVLARVGRLLRASARNVDLPARFGGEEFAVLLYDTMAEGATAFAERFLAHLRELRFTGANGQPFAVTASAGIAVGTELFDPDELVDAADRAMYRAKADGRDRVVGVTLSERRAPGGGPVPLSFSDARPSGD